MSKLAPKLGLSDRGLAKICESRNVPVSPRGYWAKLAHGHKVKQPALAAWTGNGDGRIWIGGEPKAQKIPESLPPGMAFERSAENRIVVPQRLGKAHPLISRTRSLLDAVKEDQNGRLYQIKGAVNLAVSSAALPRALRIMNALVVALDVRGYAMTVGIGARGHWFTFANVLGERIAFRVVEGLKRVPAKANDYRWKYVDDGPRRDVRCDEWNVDGARGIPEPARIH
jgi:hypothetical protein